MEREQKDKLSFSFRQIFVGGVFVLGRPRFLRFFQSSLGSPIFSSNFFEKNFFFFSLIRRWTVFLASLYINSLMWSLIFLNSLSLLDIYSAISPSNHSLDWFFFLTHYLHKKKKINLKTYNSTLRDIYGISVGEKLKKYYNPKNIHINNTHIRFTLIQNIYIYIYYSRFSSNLWESLMNFMVDIKML